MDLPPSGWYPDPYGTPRLLRWWDGSVWTQHTHPDVTADEVANGGLAGGGAAGDVQATTIQPMAVLGAGVQTTTVQAAVGSRQPSADRLRTTRPPTGRPTAPQPALPDSPAAAAYQAAAYQAAVTTVQPGVQADGLEHTVIHTPDFGQPDGLEHTITHTPDFVQPGMQPTTVQQAGLPTAVQPGYPQPGYPQPGYGQPGGGDGPGTQVMPPVGADPWQLPAGASDPWLLPSGPGAGGPGMGGNRYGYQAAKRRRRLVIGGISAGAVAAVAVVAVIALNLGGSHAPAANAVTPPPTVAPTSAAPSTPASPTTSPSPSLTPSGSLLSDGQSQVSYALLPAPWAGTGCPPSVNNGTFAWTAGQYATAGQVNGGATTWYGEACSGPLPAQYGYTSTAQLQTTAENLANTFQNTYYNALGHTATPGLDQPFQVSGHAAWEVTYGITYTNGAAQGVTWADEQAAVVVVDTGAGTPPAVFFTSIPQNLGENNVSALVASLQVTAGATPTPATTPTASDAAAGDGGQGGFGGGDGGGNGNGGFGGGGNGGGGGGGQGNGGNGAGFGQSNP